MCTLSFFPTNHGMRLGMNRDEHKSRIKALPPSIHQNQPVAYLAPNEPGGLTWIGVGTNGNVFALLNWYSIHTKSSAPSHSRGKIIPATIHHRTQETLQDALLQLVQQTYRPFRLITFLSKSQVCIEWRHDGIGLEKLPHAWQPNLWASSGFHERNAQNVRHLYWQKSKRTKIFGSVPWIRSFHQSHLPDKGAYSVCMHREEAETVSYTEIEIKKNLVLMSYAEGPPCLKPNVHQEKLNLRKDESHPAPHKISPKKRS